MCEKEQIPGFSATVMRVTEGKMSLREEGTIPASSVHCGFYTYHLVTGHQFLLRATGSHET